MTIQSAPTSYIPGRWRRTKPLRRCPDLSCKREGRCLGLALGGHCLKTIYSHPDDWAQELADKLNAYIAKCRREHPGSIPTEEDIDPNDDSWKIVWKRVLEERIAEENAKQAHALAKPPPSRKTRPKQGR